MRFGDPAGSGVVTRLSDGKTTTFADLNALRDQQIDGLTFEFDPAGANGERVLFKPFAGVASNMQMLVTSPRDLAAANPVNGAMGTSNGGTLQLAGLQATGAHWKTDGSGLADPAEIDSNGLVGDNTLSPSAVPAQVTLRYDQTKGGFVVTGTDEQPLNVPPPGTYNPGDTAIPYTPGQPISLNGWSITLQGTPKDGDTVTIGNALDPLYGDRYTRNAGNAGALQALRDVKMFDDATLSDGYASLMAQVGTRTQSALYAANLSGSIANNLEASRTAVSGVNLDEEAARLIQFQQAYQASAKMLQIAQTIFDNLLQTVSR